MEKVLDVADLSVESNSTVLGINDSKRDAAISWLEIVDSGEYALSWSKAAPVFQERISSSKWIRKLTQVRTPQCCKTWDFLSFHLCNIARSNFYGISL